MTGIPISVGMPASFAFIPSSQSPPFLQFLEKEFRFTFFRYPLLSFLDPISSYLHTNDIP